MWIITVVFDSIKVYKNRIYSFKLTRHDNFDEESLRWQIILGGWEGVRSMIIERYNPNTQGRCAEKYHTKNDFDTLKNNFAVTVADELITITNNENGEIFMTCSSEDISKSNLSHMSVSSGLNEVSGNLQIEKIRGLLKLLFYWTIYFTVDLKNV